MTEPQKDTIYVDVDDEITNIIEKVKSSEHKIVALVLPKRATVLQSVVNMKLLKRSADGEKKKLVLITSEAGLLPLAGAIGLHVAKNLQSKPAIPAGPSKEDEIPESLVHEEELEDDEPELDENAPIGKLAGGAAAAAAVSNADEDSTPAAALAAEETIEMDDDDEPAAGGNSKKDKKAAKAKKDSKLKVPNFERFRKWLILGGIALVVLLIGGYFALVRLPKATITISTDTKSLNVNTSFTANTANKTFDAASKQVPAQVATVTKTGSQNAPATGTKNMGTTATGSMTMTAKVCNSITPPSSVPSGTGVSSGGQTYITQQTATFTFDPPIVGGCINYKSSSTSITAQSGGANFNTASGATFTVAGRSDITATGSASGGTDNIVKVVTQSDVDTAKAKLNGQTEADDAKNTLSSTLQKDGMMPITSSLNGGTPTITSTPAVGAQGDTVTINSSTVYTMLGVNQENLNTVVDEQINSQIDKSKQAIQNNGLNQATYTVTGGTNNPNVAVQTTATIGPNFDQAALKKEIAGKKKGQTIEIISSNPSVKSVTVHYSPFWVTKTPGDPNKVILVFNKAN